MKNPFFKVQLKILILICFVGQVYADEDKSPAFRLKRGVGACSNLPTEADNFVCHAIGWPDQNARIDLIRQEFVNKHGRVVRWGLFDYYYYFTGIKKCEPYKEMIIEHLISRKDLEELWQKLGPRVDCVRKGRGWIQTRNIELFKTTSLQDKPPKDQHPSPIKKHSEFTSEHPLKVPRQLAAHESPMPQAPTQVENAHPPDTRVSQDAPAPTHWEPARPVGSEPFPKEFH